MLRHQPRFHCAVGAQPRHWNAARAQRFGYRQRGEDMPAGAAGQDHHWRLRRGDAIARAHAILSKIGSTRDFRRLVPRTGAGGGGVDGTVDGGSAEGAASPRSSATWRSARFNS